MLAIENAKSLVRSICIITLLSFILLSLPKEAVAQGADKPHPICGECTKERVKYMCTQVLPHCPDYYEDIGKLYNSFKQDMLHWIPISNRCHRKARAAVRHCFRVVRENSITANQLEQGIQRCKRMAKRKWKHCNSLGSLKYRYWRRRAMGKANWLLNGECPSKPDCLKAEAAGPCGKIKSALDEVKKLMTCDKCSIQQKWESVRKLLLTIWGELVKRCRTISEEMWECRHKGHRCPGQPGGPIPDDDDDCKDDKKLMSLMFEANEFETQIPASEFDMGLEAAGCGCTEDSCPGPDDDDDATPTPTATPTPSPTATASPTPTPTPTATTTPTDTATATPVPTESIAPLVSTATSSSQDSTLSRDKLRKIIQERIRTAGSR